MVKSINLLSKAENKKLLLSTWNIALIYTKPLLKVNRLKVVLFG